MFKFNGIDLESFVKVISIESTLLSNRNNTFLDIPSSHGEIYKGFKLEKKKITVSFDVKENNFEDYQSTIDTLSSIFAVDDEKELIISENKRIYLALPDGEIKRKKITKNMERFEINFICSIPFSHCPNAKIYNGEKILSIKNEGNVSTPAILDVSFNENATYLQVDSPFGESILIGEYPKLENEIVEKTSIVAEENCETTANFVYVNGEVDAKRSVSGTIQPNDGASSWCIQASDFGNGENWHGPALRYNLTSNVEDFECIIDLNHDSSGKINYNETCDTNESSTVKYKVTITSINMRQSRTTSSKVLTKVPKNTYLNVIQVVNGWLNTTYNGKTGWIKISAGLKKATFTTATYYTKQRVSLRASGSKSSKLLATIPAGTAIIVYPTQKSGNYTKAEYRGMSGYVYTSYIVEGDKVTIENDIEVDTAEDKLGIIEAYGYDQLGNKLFKFMLCDENEYYESTYPLVQIGNTTFLEDTSFNVPEPKTATKIEGFNDNLTVKTTTLRSGKVGNWNEFAGTFIIKREKNEWYAEILKYKNGVLEKSLKSQRMKKEGFPEGSLNHIVVFFGKYADKNVVDTMTFNRLVVKNLNQLEENTDKNVILFKQGDELKIDFSQNEVLLNNVKDMTNVDIGSKFFELEVGEYDIRLSSDADITSSIIYNERWLD